MRKFTFTALRYMLISTNGNSVENFGNIVVFVSIEKGLTKSSSGSSKTSTMEKPLSFKDILSKIRD